MAMGRPREFDLDQALDRKRKKQMRNRLNRHKSVVAGAALAETNWAASEARSPLSASNTRPPAHAPADVARSAARNRMTAFMTVPS